MNRITERKEITALGEIRVFTLKNSTGAMVELSSLGAGIRRILVPDCSGRLDDVVLGYENSEAYCNDGHCAGKTVGRYANRIALGEFTLDGLRYSLPINNGPNHLHGGPEGLQNRIWDAEIDGDAVVFFDVLPDGHAGYPGNLHVKARFCWTDDNSLVISYEAMTDKATVVSLTNHTYFNLNGHDSGTALDHELQLNAARYLVANDTLVPTGELAAVGDTPMDFREYTAIGKRIDAEFPALKVGKGYDACWAVDGYENGPEMKEVGCLRSTRSHRKLTVSSDHPGVQFYSGNWISDTPPGKGGYRYSDYDCVAIECQEFPDSPNRPDFPSVTLRPGEVYKRNIIFSFSVE